MNEDELFNKELDILRQAVDETENKQKRKRLQNPEITKIIEIVEHFITEKKLICYGGTAINNILPETTQFYDKELDLPDYDFFSPNAMNHSIELADLYHRKGYTEVNANAGMHYGTYKVFVNYIPIADITQIPSSLFNSLFKHSIVFSDIHYAPPNYLRMSMYLELSRPDGDVSRWEKVLKRLVLLNKSFPGFSKNYFNVSECKAQSYQRPLTNQKNNSALIFNIVKDIFIKQDVIFFGAFAASLYGQYMQKNRHKVKKIPDFDVISTHPKELLSEIKKELSSHQIKKVQFKKYSGIADIISDHYELTVGSDSIAFVYTDSACHNYNIHTYNGQMMKIATIDTMLSYYLAFIYINKSHYNTDRILCMAHYLFTIQQNNRLKQKGLLKRFSHTCYGSQHGREEIREIKQKKFVELKNSRKSLEFKKWFLKYYPNDISKNKDKEKKQKKITKKHTNKKLKKRKKQTKKKYKR